MPIVLVYGAGLGAPNTVGNLAGIRYAHQTQPWDSPLSFGLQSLIEYNGYIINDRYQSDRIRVTGLTGLDDADVSDSREVIPGDHGETAYDSYYRGRTFVMSGRIEAGSLGVLKRLERDLKAAYAPLVESPMKFRWFDISDSFDDPGALQNYSSAFSNTVYVSASQGVLLVPPNLSFLLLRTADNRMFGDSQQTIRATIGSIDGSYISLVPSFKDANNYVQVRFTPDHLGSGLSMMMIQSVAGGVANTLLAPLVGIVTGSFVVGQSVWLRCRREGDLVTGEVWTSPPQVDQLPAYSASGYLTGADADDFGDGVLSQVGFGANILSNTWALDDYKIESLYPGDISFNAKKLSSISIKDSQDSPSHFNRVFQITMRASTSFALGATQSRSATLVPSAGSTPPLGFSFPLSFPLSFRSYLPGVVAQANSILPINNRGTVFTRPKFYVYGAVNGFTLINLTNNQQISWAGTLLDGDYLIFDCAKRKLTNSAGTNMLQYFTSSSSVWMWLEPGWNDIYFGGSGYSGNTKLMAFFKNGWL